MHVLNLNNLYRTVHSEVQRHTHNTSQQHILDMFASSFLPSVCSDIIVSCVCVCVGHVTEECTGDRGELLVPHISARKSKLLYISKCDQSDNNYSKQTHLRSILCS